MSADYPNEPGHRGIGGSVEAANMIATALPHLQGLVRAVIAERGAVGATSDEIAIRLGWEKHRVRPRTAELRKAGRIIDSRKRRPSLTGVQSIVWVLPDYSQPVVIAEVA